MSQAGHAYSIYIFGKVRYVRYIIRATQADCFRLVDLYNGRYTPVNVDGTWRRRLTLSILYCRFLEKWMKV